MVKSSSECSSINRSHMFWRNAREKRFLLGSCRYLYIALMLKPLWYFSTCLTFCVILVCTKVFVVLSLGFKYHYIEETNTSLFLFIDLCSEEALPLSLKNVLKQDLDFYYFLLGTVSSWLKKKQTKNMNNFHTLAFTLHQVKSTCSVLPQVNALILFSIYTWGTEAKTAQLHKWERL